jgi:hypothetical protein
MGRETVIEIMIFGVQDGIGDESFKHSELLHTLSGDRGLDSCNKPILLIDCNEKRLVSFSS